MISTADLHRQAVIASQQQTSFTTQNVQPPTNVFLHQGAAFRIRGNSGGALTSTSTIIFNYRVLTPDGEISPQESTIPISGLLTTGHIFPAREGFLLSAEIRPGTAVGGSFTRGSFFVIVEIIQSKDVPIGLVVPLQTIIADYVTAANIPNFPSGTPISPATAQGVELWTTHGPVTAGNEILIVFAGFIRRKLLSFRCDFQASAVPGLRQIQLLLNTSVAGEERYYPINGTVAPGELVTLQWDLVQSPRPGLAANTLTTRNATLFGTLPLETLFVRQTGTSGIRTETLNLDAAGDQFTAYAFGVEQWGDY